MHVHVELVEVVLDCCVVGIGCSSGLGHCTCSMHDPCLSGIVGFGSRVGLELGWLMVLSHFGTEGRGAHTDCT